MNEEIKKIQKEVIELKDTVSRLEQIISQISETTYKTGKREIINREVQFLQRVYDKNGGIVTEINP